MAADPRSFSNRYEVVRALARGGMAEVYLARDQLLDRPVAVKVLFPEYAREQSFVERFRREAQAAANLSHPNIVAIYDWGQEHSTYFIVMEYVDGQSLRDLIRSRGKMSPHEAAQIGADIAGALGYAHRAGVVHRDVKPGNVLITPNGTVKVTDFGIARAGTSEGLTQTGSVMGTATYFSPEQAQGLPCDGRSDVYSLGVVLYEMVTGTPPFSGDTPVAVAYKHVREEVERPSQRVPALPPDYERIVLAAMAKDPDARYQSADDLRSDLLRFLRGQPPIAAPVSAEVAAITGSMTSLTPTAAQPTTATPRVAPPVAQRTVEEEERQRKSRGPIVAAIALLLVIAGVILAVLLLRGGGGKTFATPNVVGQTEAQARFNLVAAGFKVATQPVTSDTVPNGSVVSQSPSAGTKLHKGDTVTLHVSSGPSAITLPDVTGQPFDNANLTLAGLGLKVNQQTTPSENIPANTVISMNPGPNAQVQKGSTVTLVVSAGPAPVTVPNVQNDDQVTATQALTSAGFKVQRINQASGTVPSGLVIGTDPAGNTQAARNSTVKLFVSTGPQNTTVPDVTNSTQSQAQSTLSAAGFRVSVVTVPSTPSNNGIVLAQSPTGNSQAAQGSTVTITVGQATSTTSSSTSTTT
ncbi:MAG: Stk1 family PASTA domain-containing Ser/Thr kinase [Actinobacteria bacterium]|nr:Stk1 family PASTA domain-containing Ser/Thr kinase [Actinomycetota bacterium]